MGVPVGVAVGSASARAKAAAESKRSAGTLASALATACSTHSGTLSRTVRSRRGVSVNRRAIIAWARRAAEGRLAREHLVEHGAERVDVGSRVEVARAARLLRAHVGGRAHRHSGSGQPGVPFRHGARDAEIRDQRAAVLRQQHVLRLDVPVDHSLLVGVLERKRGFAPDAESLVDGQLVLALQPVPEALALHERHGVPELAAGFTGIEHCEDVGMLEAGGQADLPLEPFGAERDRQLGVQDLEGDVAVVLEVAREVDRGHAAAPELALERVAVLEGLRELGPNVGPGVTRLG